MRHALQFALLISATAALTACGGGGGTSATLTPFTSWSAVQPGTSITVNGISQSGTYSFDTNTERITSRSFDASASAASSAVTFDSNNQLTALTINPAGGTAISFTKGTDAFRNLPGNLYIVEMESSDTINNALLANPYGFGWDYQSFGVWATGAGTGSGTVGTMSVGAQTAGSAIPTSGTAVYSGNTLGYYVSQVGTYYYTTSGMTAAANFDQRSINFATTGTKELFSGAALTPLNLTGVLGYASATNQIAGSVTTGSGLTGSVNGRFYGPAAQEIGGTFSVTSGTNALEGYAGAFGGKKP